MPTPTLREEIAVVLPEMIELRHHIHQHPELAFEEHATSELVAERLAQWGYEVHRGLAGTGVIGQLRQGNGRKSLGIRADMDALPIVEATGLAYASRHHGKMHACGHDGHTATLLAAARHLAQTRRFNGTLNLIFQPAEEGGGGAKRMVDEGLFQRFPCDAVFALHNSPGHAGGHAGLSQRRGTGLGRPRGHHRPGQGRACGDAALQPPTRSSPARASSWRCSRSCRATSTRCSRRWSPWACSSPAWPTT